MSSPYDTIKGIIAHLFEAEKRRLNRAIIDFCNQNQEAYGERYDGFVYCGDFFIPEGERKGRGVHPKLLHFSLHDRFDKYIRDKRAIEADEGLISQFLFKLLEPCRTDQDVRDALPECLIPITRVKNLPRLREEGYMFVTPRDKKQWAKAHDKILFYNAARMLY